MCRACITPAGSLSPTRDAVGPGGCRRASGRHSASINLCLLIWGAEELNARNYCPFKRVSSQLSSSTHSLFASISTPRSILHSRIPGTTLPCPLSLLLWISILYLGSFPTPQKIMDANKILDLRIHSPACARNTQHCSNNALVGSDKLKYGSACQRSDSVGRRSAHNCKNRGGSSYLCVQCGVAHCYVSLLPFNFPLLPAIRLPPELTSVVPNFGTI